MREQRAIVIGAGVGGLAAAIELAAHGWAVHVVERAANPGGKMRVVNVAGRAIDSGPTVMTMRWVFDALFATAGESLDTHLTLEPLPILARHAWRGGERLDLHADVAESAEAIAAFAGPGEKAGFLRFCTDAAGIYRTLKDTFLTQQQTHALGLTARVGFGRLPAMLALRPFDTLWGALGDYFHDRRLRQLFGRYATYVGSSPFLSPATLMLIAHVEQTGVWSVAGGMHRLAQVLAALAASMGAAFTYDTHVTAIRTTNGRVSGVALANGETLAADAVVVNADPAALAAGLFGPGVRTAGTAPPPGQQSLSAVTWALLAETDGFPLSRHTVFFSDDSAAEFEDLFVRRCMPRMPTAYICAQDRLDGPPHENPERLFVLVNAPAVSDAQGEASGGTAACQRSLFELLGTYGLRVQPTSDIVTTGPADFARLFPASAGALYGRATHGPFASFARPRSWTGIGGLYLAGGGAHPGAGVPMAALSGRLAAQRLLADQRSI